MTPSTHFSISSIPSLARLAVYAKALHCAALVQSIRCRETLRSQLVRAMDSVVLNIAEGACDNSRAMKTRSYRIARASLFEVAAAIDLVNLSRTHERSSELSERLAEVDRMLRALTRP
jgi:four helix bundle protein